MWLWQGKLAVVFVAGCCGVNRGAEWQQWQKNSIFSSTMHVWSSEGVYMLCYCLNPCAVKCNNE